MLSYDYLRIIKIISSNVNSAWQDNHFHLNIFISPLNLSCRILPDKMNDHTIYNFN